MQRNFKVKNRCNCACIWCITTGKPDDEFFHLHHEYWLVVGFVVILVPVHFNPKLFITNIYKQIQSFPLDDFEEVCL